MPKTGTRPQMLKQLEKAALLRASGKSWEQVAEEMGKPFNTITKWPGEHPREWAAAYDLAWTRYLDEAGAEALHALRGCLRDEDRNIWAKAGQSILAHKAAMRPQKLDVDLVVRTATEGLEEVLQQVGISEEQIDAVLEGMGKRLGG